MQTPLAERIRPQTPDELCGQQHLLGENKPLRRLFDLDTLPNLIFYGPSGVGKTTVANMLAKKSGRMFYKMNATTASTADIKDMLSQLDTIQGENGVLLYLDEIQYFNKRQQQTLLEYIENGSVTLIASTTENPYFYVYNAVISRCTVFEFKPLSVEDILPAIQRGVVCLAEENGAEITFSEDTLVKALAASGGGDVRKALNALEIAVLTAERQNGKIHITRENVQSVIGKSTMRYDRNGDDHYDIVSAYQKSMRGSDPDAALHYLARLLEAGDLPSACRRLMVCACEDVGLAYPQIIPIVKSAVDAAQMLGLPEARIPLADAVVLVCLSPKSNSAYMGINAAMADVQKGNIGPIPRQLQNKHFDGADAIVRGQHYLYPHDYPNHYVRQQYLPDVLKGKKYYRCGDNKTEQSFLTHLEEIKKSSGD
ncbi:MAG: replication-associated recombination protein A [Clostridia bacterium]|nr:replication-associated recombination protein A [Clostridia bacterium]